MGTFLEFYQALLKFVNFKLFTDIGLTYPLQNEALPFSSLAQDSSKKHFTSDSALDCSKVKMLQKHYQKISKKAQSSTSEF